MYYCVSGLAFRNLECGFEFPTETGVFYKTGGVMGCTGFFVNCFNSVVVEQKINFCGSMTRRLTN